MFNGIDSDSAAEFTFFIPVPVMLGAGGVTPLTLGYIKIQVVLYSCIAIMRVAC
jgi:undecaprenyl pyrophosphate phosphatase UppP